MSDLLGDVDNSYSLGITDLVITASVVSGDKAFLEKSKQNKTFQELADIDKNKRFNKNDVSFLARLLSGDETTLKKYAKLEKKSKTSPLYWAAELGFLTLVKKMNFHVILI